VRTLGIYKEYIFGLLFLKRLSDVFDEKRTEFASAVQPSFAILKKSFPQSAFCAQFAI